jgi:hypothetical protein
MRPKICSTFIALILTALHLCKMGKAGIQLIKQVNVLLPVLLCSIFAALIPVPTHAASDQDTLLQKYPQEKTALALLPGTICAGTPEGLSPVDRPLLDSFIKLYLQKFHALAMPAALAPLAFASSKGDCGLHTILANGP